ncbi:hypothetical protein COO60DRAFT_1459551 [Scenedesmus sp. NREL 46B-D3]|nr:hypothetical protein COO60DRAFT_1459551 [Scenedesmus sp. NREL 46B-D3]
MEPQHEQNGALHHHNRVGGNQQQQGALAAAAHLLQGRGSRPPGAGPATPSASDESERSHDQQWCLPQPKPALDEAHTEWRPAAPLFDALQCRLCEDLLKEPITAAECSHSCEQQGAAMHGRALYQSSVKRYSTAFEANCYDCVDKCITIGGRANFCPVCNLLLGPNPYEHNKLKYDFTLDSLVRKVFPRPSLDAALEARRLEREEATRQAKANINRRPGRPATARPSTAQQRGAAGSSPAAFGAVLPPLPKPYLRAPAGLDMGRLRFWLGRQLAARKPDAVPIPFMRIHCAGRLLQDADQTLAHLRESVWLPHCAAHAAAGGVAGGGGGGVQGAAAPAAAAGQVKGVPDPGADYDATVMLLYYSP